MKVPCSVWIAITFLRPTGLIDRTRPAFAVLDRMDLPSINLSRILGRSRIGRVVPKIFQVACLPPTHRMFNPVDDPLGSFLVTALSTNLNLFATSHFRNLSNMGPAF